MTLRETPLRSERGFFFIRPALGRSTSFPRKEQTEQKMADERIKPTNQLNIELSEEVADGIYSNLAITHSNSNSG